MDKVKLGKNPLFTPKEIIAVADIHSRYEHLESLMNKILPLKEDAHLIFLGDLIDRGKDLFLVLNYLKDLKEKYPNQVFFLKGNHDRSLIYFLTEPDHWAYKINLKNWKKHGGKITLKQLAEKYGDSPNKIKQGLTQDNYWSIFGNMLLYYETDNYFLSHAPLDPFLVYFETICIEKKIDINESALEGFADKLGHKLYSTFTKETPFIIPNYEHLKINKKFICGHQPSNSLEPRIKGNRVFLDTTNNIFAYSSEKGLISS